MFSWKNPTINLLCCLVISTLPSCNRSITRFEFNAINSKESPLYSELLGGYIEDRGEKTMGLFIFTFDSNGNCRIFPDDQVTMAEGKWQLKNSQLIILKQKVIYHIHCNDSAHRDSVVEFPPDDYDVEKITKLTEKELIIRPWHCLFCKELKLQKLSKNGEAVYQSYKWGYCR
jgi:hypothetical protein